MRRVAALALAAASLLAAAGTAQAADPTPALDTNAIVQGIKLATLCSNCAVVDSVKKDKKKGDASGVGAVGGAVVGGVVGNQVTDSTLGTVGGAAVGGLLGHEAEKRLKSHTVYVTTVTMKDGTKAKFTTDKDPGFKAGTVVEVTADKTLKKR